MKKYRFDRLSAGLFVLAFVFGLFAAPLSARGDVEREESAQTKTVTHSLGTIEIPASVERVVTLHWAYTEAVLALGMQPVGVADIKGYKKWVDIPAALDEAVVDVGGRRQPNLERIIELRPDLIITETSLAVDNYDELNAIAPTLLFNPYKDKEGNDASQYGTMLEIFQTVADALNRQEAGEAVIAELEGTFERAQAALKQAGMDGESFVLSQSYLSGDSPVFRLFTDTAMTVEIIELIGLNNTWKGPPGKYRFSKVDFEGMGGVDAANFFWIVQPDVQEVITNAPVWDSLSFVRSGTVYPLGGNIALFGGPLSAVKMVERISAALGLTL